MSSSQAAIVALGSALTGAVIAVGSAIAYSRYAALYYDDGDSESGDYPVPRAKAVSRSRSRSRGNMRRRLSMDGVGRVTKIALTGGPCGGKSSCLNQVMKRLQEQGYMVFVAPEMPTMLKQHCECPFPFVPDASVADSAHMLCWEGNKMRMQQELEDSLHDIAASSGKKTVIICDRGLPDSAAYTSEHEFQTILEEHDWILDKLMNRYSLVVHLESAAIDTSLYAQLAENNPARHESEEEARAQDLRTQQAWATHPNVAMIRNMLCGEDFELKKQLTVNAVFEHLGLTTVGATTTARKMYLLKTHVPSAIFERESIRTDVFTIQSTFLRDDEEAFYRVVERRGRVGGVWSFSLVRSIKQGGGRGNFIDEARIGAAMYNELLNEADPERKSVRKKRTVFTCHVGVCGRDVTHRVEEVVAVEDAGPPRGPGPAAPASGKDGANGTPRKGSVAANGNRENVELLTVDVPDGSTYEPPDFLRPFVSHELAEKRERERYSLRVLASGRRPSMT